MTEQKTIDNLLYTRSREILRHTGDVALQMESQIQEDGTIKGYFVVIYVKGRESYNLLNLAVARYFELIKS